VATFLRETCRKAGLAADDWQKPDAEVFLFEAEYFSENEPSASFR
jgi:AMMECR1 domain-containing protein